MTAGRWLGRARAMARNLRIQLEQEIDTPPPRGGGSISPAQKSTEAQNGKGPEPDER